MARDGGAESTRPLRRPPTMRMTLGREGETEPSREGDKGQNGHRRDRRRGFIRPIHRRPAHLAAAAHRHQHSAVTHPIDIAIPAISFFGRTVIMPCLRWLATSHQFMG